jgi:SAM-dependent methyltransferase/uncharacterized protein YbaR (Trm112 family)
VSYCVDWWVRKDFFFEKKKQKTFIRLDPTVRPARLGESKSFLVLFFKKERLPLKRTHLSAFAPICPTCRNSAPLIIGSVAAEQDGDIRFGTLHCPSPACQCEFPIVDFIPVIVPDLAALMAQRGVDFFARADLPASVESLLGDALGPDGWFDALRQGFSTYGWDAYGDLGPDAPVGLQPGAARRCLERLLALGDVPARGAHAVDLGCAGGRTSFALAAHMPDALVLGVDTNFGLLRIARAAAAGRATYPLRRIGLVYDRQDFAVSLLGAERVDFWAMDALALPLPPARADVVAALNLLDCVPDPRGLLNAMAGLLAQGAHLLLATPFDWSSRATRVENWIGGHSQRAAHAGGAEVFLDALLAQCTPPLAVLGKDAAFAWQTRLHARSSVQYLAYLVALQRG